MPGASRKTAAAADTDDELAPDTEPAPVVIDVDAAKAAASAPAPAVAAPDSEPDPNADSPWVQFTLATHVNINGRECEPGDQVIMHASQVPGYMDAGAVHKCEPAVQSSRAAVLARRVAAPEGLQRGEWVAFPDKQ